MKSEHNFSVLFFLKGSKEDPNIGYIFLRVTVDGRRTEISLKRKVLKENWNADKGALKGTKEEIRKINNEMDHDLRGINNFIIVIRDHRFDQFEIDSRWIAINPDLARFLGWEPEPRNLFAWKNADGELMAESIFWSNGNINFTARKDGEVGQGWFVSVSEKALNQIKAMGNDLFLQKKLTRLKYEDSEYLTNQKFVVSKII